MLADWGTILDLIDDAVIVIDRSDIAVYANHAAQRAMLSEGGSVGDALPWTKVLELAGDVRAFSEPARRSGLELGTTGMSWSIRMWPLSARAVAIILKPEAQVTERVSVIAQRLGLSDDQATLALRVAEGRPNRDIADDFRVSLSTIKGRLWRLYRKLGVRNRAELAGQIVQALMTTTDSVPAAETDAVANGSDGVVAQPMPSMSSEPSSEPN